MRHPTTTIPPTGMALLVISFLPFYPADDLLLWMYVLTMVVTMLAVASLLFHYSRAVTLYAFDGTSFEM